MPVKNNQQKITFPSNISDTIIGLLSKYNLQESSKEFFAKLKKGEEPNGRKIAKLLVAVKTGAMSQENLSQKLGKVLSINKKDAVSLANEIKKDILAKKASSADIKQLPKTIKKIRDKKKFPDVYREVVE